MLFKVERINTSLRVLKDNNRQIDETITEQERTNKSNNIFLYVYQL